MRESPQARVRQTMLEAGGYWRPLAAVARLLEELGELAELIGGEPGAAHEDAELSAELADLWIITTALADQFLARVDEPGTKEPATEQPGTEAPGTEDPSAGSIGALLSSAGEIARVVNYYDGPKTPRSTAALPSLDEAIARFHGALGAFAGAHAVNLDRAVADKLAVIRGRDMERFAREDSDPSTAACLTRLAAAVPATAKRRLWGAPPLSADPARGAARIGPSLGSFTRAAARERLDGYAIAIPPGAEDGWVARLLGELDIDALGLRAETLNGERESFVLLGRRVPARPGDDLA